MKRSGVIGHPISHSKSPLIHGYWLKYYGIDGEYKAYDVAPENLWDTVQYLKDMGLAGFNVTLPHKQTMLKICTTLNADAERIGAVNTVVFHPDGEIEGRNTDGFGFMANAEYIHPDFNWTSAPVVVLGAGGASRAILDALVKKGVTEIRLANRSIAAAEELAEYFPIRIYEWQDRHKALEGAGALINTTSLGMNGKPSLEIDLSSLNEKSMVYDIVYAPLKTALLQQAEARGFLTTTGIGMLLHQARPAFQAWFGRLPEVTTELERKILV